MVNYLIKLESELIQDWENTFQLSPGQNLDSWLMIITSMLNDKVSACSRELHVVNPVYLSSFRI